MFGMREPNLVAWQWALYGRNHTTRANLTIHILTVPLFFLGVLELIAAPIIGPWWLAILGPLTMALVMALQGRGHRQEPEAPVPFAGPRDVISRILVEQLFTFPRYVATGGFAKAWRNSH